MPDDPVRIISGSNVDGPSDPVRITNWDDFVDAVATALGSLCHNVITVCKEGGDFDNLRDAMDSIVAPSATNRYLVEVGPGVYLEDNPIPGKEYTIIQGSSPNATRITATNANQDLFTSANFCTIDGISVSGVSGTGWVFQIAAAHGMILSNSVMFNCSNGVRLNHANGFLTVDNNLVFALTPMTCAICNNAGTLTVRGGGVGPGSTITTMFDFDGANAISTVLGFLSFETGITTMVQADNDARSVFNGCSFVGMVDGAILQGGSDTRFVATSIFLAQQDAIRLPNVGAATNLVGQGLTVEDSTRYDINILAATATVSGYGQASLDQMNFTSGAQFTANFIDLKEDDEGLNVIGELHVGAPEAPSESVFGGGDSYTRGMLVYTFNPAGAVWTDVSTAARSASGSTFTFPAVAQNNAIYVASTLMNGGDYLQHFGIKAAITAAAVLNGGEIVVEYWNGGAWVAINHMSTLASSPLTQFAKDIFERTGSEQIRYPSAFLAAWTKNDPGMGLGTNYFWIRYRIATAVTTAPIFQQWKLHTNRFEVNLSGLSEYFGGGRYQKDLIVHIALNDPVTGAAPGNAAIAFSATTTLTLDRNQFNNNAVDAFGELITIPVGIDTSIPLTLEVIWYADTVNAGDVELVTFFAQLEVGDLWDGTHAESSVTQVETVGAGTQFVSRLTSFDIDISELVPGELLVFQVRRDATVGNDPPDTLVGNIKFGSVRAFATFWRP